jgi:hypothetical protein
MRCNGHGNARRRGRFWTDRRMPSMVYCYIITSIEWRNYDRSTSLQQMKNRYAPDLTSPRPDDADDRVGGCAKGCHRCCTAPQPRGAGDVGGGVPDMLISGASSPHDFQFTLYKQKRSRRRSGNLDGCRFDAVVRLGFGNLNHTGPRI